MINSLSLNKLFIFSEPVPGHLKEIKTTAGKGKILTNQNLSHVKGEIFYVVKN